MDRFLGKVNKSIKSLDLFGSTVSLTYKGQTAFNTCSGGLISLILILVIATGSILQLNSLYFHPEFVTHPVEYDFSLTNMTLDFSANSVAIGMSIFDFNFNATQEYTNSKVRVQIT